MVTLLTPAEIKQKRLALGLTQQRLAELSKLAIRTVVRFEHGDYALGGTVYALKKITDALTAYESQH
jgi:transcriptional regulator with XRE-family HTH domain